MIEITKISSKGQVVIPRGLRKGFNEGDKLIVIRNDKQIILKKVETLMSNDPFNSKISKMYKTYLDKFFDNYRKEDPNGAYDTDRKDIQP